MQPLANAQAKVVSHTPMLSSVNRIFFVILCILRRIKRIKRQLKAYNEISGIF